MRLGPLPLIALAAALLAPSAGASEEPRRLKILFTNDVHGYLEPCG